MFNFKTKIQKILCKKSKNYYRNNDWFIDILFPIFKYHRYSIDSYPTIVDSKEEWDFILDKMIYHLYMMKIDNVFKEKDINNPTAMDFELAYNIIKRNKTQFFELFKKYFF